MSDNWIEYVELVNTKPEIIKNRLGLVEERLPDDYKDI